MTRNIAILAATLALISCSAASSTSTESTASNQSAILNGTPNSKPQVLLIWARTYSGGSMRCSGSYFAPRVLVTTASCIPSNTKDIYAYYGKNFAVDQAQVPNIPAPGQTSVWAKADSWEINPTYNATLHDGEIAVIYLDRKLPFDPLPLARFNLDSSYKGKKGTIVGWGANQVFSADITQYAGFGIERSAVVPIVGAPTSADYHADDPNPGMLDATVRSHYLKLGVGATPDGGVQNGCTGDGGGPFIYNQYGQDYIAGVGLWTGLWCADYQIETRIDPYLPFFDNAYMKGGQATVIPRLECVAQATDGSLTAYFGYTNKNGVNVQVPYGSANAFALDVGNARPSLFLHGDHGWAFKVAIPKGKQLNWKLSPTNSPTTELKVDANSKRCASNDTHIPCDGFCRAQAAVTCPADYPPATVDQCISACVGGFGFCDPEWLSYIQCVAKLTPDPANWLCYPNFPQPQVSGTACVDESNNLFACYGF